MRSRLIPAPPPPLPLHSLIATLTREVNPQDGSPLYSTIPPELRDVIFRIMLTSYDDESAPYPENAYYNRPGYRFRHRIDTALLSTCCRIYREAHMLPVSLNEHVFWASGRGPRNARIEDPISRFFRLTAEQREAVEHVHLFAQMFWLEDNFRRVCESHLFRMRHLKITIRHSDWWTWESNIPLAMQDTWTENLKAITNLESLEVELETIERDKLQLEAIVKSMQSWRIKAGNDRVLTTDGSKITYGRYAGPSKYDGVHYDFQTNRWRWDHQTPEYTGTTTPSPPLFYVGYTLHWVSRTV